MQPYRKAKTAPATFSILFLTILPNGKRNWSRVGNQFSERDADLVVKLLNEHWAEKHPVKFVRA